MIGQEIIDCEPMVGHEIIDYEPMVGHAIIDCEPMVGHEIIDMSKMNIYLNIRLFVKSLASMFHFCFENDDFIVFFFRSSKHCLEGVSIHDLANRAPKD